MTHSFEAVPYLLQGVLALIAVLALVKDSRALLALRFLTPSSDVRASLFAVLRCQWRLASLMRASRSLTFVRAPHFPHSGHRTFDCVLNGWASSALSQHLDFAQHEGHALTKIGYSLSTQCEGDTVQITINLVDVDVFSSTESRACRRRSGSSYNLMSHELPAPSGYLRLEPALLLEQRTG